VRIDKRGFVDVPAFVTRTGVLTYRRADGTVIRELRHPDEVFAAESLDTLRGAPVTVGHPGGGLEWVDPANAHTHEVGVVSEGRREGNFVDARLSVRRADAIGKIQSKELVEVSAAYDSDVVVEAGEYNGEKYDQRQTNITYNHVALLPPGKGRAGPDVRMRADSADAVLVSEGVTAPSQAEPASADLKKDSGAPAPVGGTMTTRKLRVDGVEYELPETAAGVLEKAVSERDENKKRADSAEAVRDQLKADLAKATDPKTVSGLVTSRVALERDASKVLGADKRFDGLTDREVHIEVLKVASPDFKTESRSDDAISAAFEYAITSGKKTNHGIKLVRDALSEDEREGGNKRADSAEEAQAKRLADLETKRATAWKGASK
jgi:uncharacterized protein